MGWSSIVQSILDAESQDELDEVIVAAVQWIETTLDYTLTVDAIALAWEFYTSQRDWLEFVMREGVASQKRDIPEFNVE